MSEPIILVFNYTEREYVSAVRFFNARRGHVRFFLLFSTIIFLAGCFILLISRETTFGSFLAISSGLVFAFYFYIHFLMPRRYFRSYKRFRNQYYLEFSEDEIYFRTDNAESRMDWKFYSDVWENTNFYFLLYPGFFTLIPKRIFLTDAQEINFRDLLKQKIKEDFAAHKFFEKNKQKTQEYALPQNPPDWKQDD